MTRSIVPIILGLVATVLLAIALFLLMADLMKDPYREYVVGTELYFSVSGISLLLLTVGLILMIKQRLYKGGVIVLFAGIASLVAFFLPGGGIVMLFYGRFYLLSTILSSILAIISGSLAIKKSEEHKGDYRGLIIPIISLLLAIAPAFLFIFFRPSGWGITMFVFFYTIPLLIIATVFNIIGMFKVRKETNPKAKIIAKTLIGLTWSMIIVLVLLIGITPMPM